MSCRCVLTNVPGGYPLSNVDIELVRTDTMAIVQVVQTNKAGEAQFTAGLPAPCFFRPRIIGKNWNLQVTDPGLGYSLYDRVVAQDGLGTDLTFTSAIAALAATGGTIGARTGDYHEGAILTIPTTKNYVIEGIGHGILEDVNFTPVMGVQIHNPAGAGGFNGVIFHVDTGARLTLRGVEVHQDRAYDCIEAHTIPSIIVEDSYIHNDSTGAGIDSSYMVRVHRSVIECGAGEAIDVGTTITYLEVTESRLTSTTYAVNGSFSQMYFEKCRMSKVRCHTTTIAERLRITDCTVAGGTAGAAGIEVGNGGHCDIQMFDNEVDGDTGHAIQIGYTTLDSPKRYQVNNNRLHSTGGHGLYIAGYVKGLTACGNMFSGNAAGYCIETANALYPEYAVFGCNTHDGSALGIYGPILTGMGGFGGDHGMLSGLGDDDHTQYLLASGARALTGNWNPGAHIIGNYDFTAKPGTLYVGDVNFELYLEAGGPVIIFDTGPDFLGYVRASNYFTFAIGGVPVFNVLSDGLEFLDGGVLAFNVWGAGMQHRGGTLFLGSVDTTKGQLILCGDGTGLDTGGYMSIYSALDWATHVTFDVYQDKLRISCGVLYLWYGDLVTGAVGVNPGPLQVDTINEYIGDAGVTVETVLIKDGLVDGKDVSTMVTASVEDWSGITNAAEDRTADMDATTIDELSDIVGTLISDLRAIGLLQ